MWIRKTQKEIEIEKNKPEYILGFKITPFRGALVFFIITFIVPIFFDLIFGKSKGRGYLPTNYVREKVAFSDLPSRFPLYLIPAVIMGVVMYIIGRKYGLKSKISSSICEICYKVKLIEKDSKCECGGKFIELDEMKWIEKKRTFTYIKQEKK